MRSASPSQQSDPAQMSAEQALLAAWQDRQDRAALETLIESYMRRIRAWSRRGGLTLREDLAAEGVIALIDAASRFPLPSAQSFASFAMPAVRGAILRAIAGLGSVVSIPERQLRDAVSGRMEGERADLIRQALQTEDFDEISMGYNSPPAEEEALLLEKQRNLRKAVAHALRPLDRHERRLVVSHLLREEIDLEVLASRLDLSVARARSLEGRALYKMRNSLMNKGFLMSDLA